MNNPRLQSVLDIFSQISAIPRCSGNEAGLRNWLKNWAGQHGYVNNIDTTGNIVIKVPGSPSKANLAPVVLQGHMDMVCEKTPDCNHDFSKDPLKLKVEGDWLTATNTTLGADNGIAIALALAIVQDDTAVHPPLELLFTVEEETGLTGAINLKPGFIEGKTLLNIDSEELGAFYVGCAGGKDTNIHLNLEFEDCPAGYTPHLVKVSGLQGGHSGMDIPKMRANAIWVLARTLNELIDAGVAIRLIDINGGTAHNAIPRDAGALILIKEAQLTQTNEVIASYAAALQKEFASADPGITLTCQPSQSPCNHCLGRGLTRKVLDLVRAIPHGVAAYSVEAANQVETSSNLARVFITHNTLHVLSSQRSSSASRLTAHTRRIEAVARLAEAQYASGNGYPAWQPNFESNLLERCCQVYKQVSGQEAKVKVIHAGLECGIIGAHYPGMDMISYGPDIRGAHSPQERLNLPSTLKVYEFTLALLASF